ncbi:hypothetical protein CERZMDRAFT_84083 [Cercospora zeae-maydis SCOH1-5]|uniref:Uncharacterized protein n=1 Tax=Cercospora zeae-maydis SCOH1-5 TaxID=717836 RepID=A0A6A6FI88_9PEZI|nr:hypothetical protein CERZMDRAFT_84083 [Cercospora zeae-maydis SCOH1-5]
MAWIWSHRVDRSSLVFCITASLAFIAKSVTIATTITLATTALVGGSTFPLSVTASIFEIVALAALLVAAGFFLRRVDRGTLVLVWIPGALVCLVGSILALVTLANARSFPRPNDSHDGHYVRHLAAAGVVIAAIGLLPQICFWAMIWPRDAPHSVLPAHDQHLPAQQTKQRRVSVYLNAIGIQQSNSFFVSTKGSSTPTSPTYPSSVTSGINSYRTSASESLHPVTSKTRLILQSPFGSRSSRSTQASTAVAVHSIRSTDEFENWDTSRVNHSFEATYQKKVTIPRLEPIPGSRPVSPAHALEGPFADKPVPRGKPLSDFVSQSPKLSPVAIIEPEQSPIRSLSQLHTRRGSTPSIAGPTSPTAEHHIHPLFRTESPVPPPLTSPRTVITASPFGGQIYSPEFALQSPRLLGSREGSRPASPAMRSRSGSTTIPPSPIDITHDALAERSFFRLAEKHSQSNSPQSPNG